MCVYEAHIAKEKVWKVFNHPWLSPPRVSLVRGSTVTFGWSGESNALVGDEDCSVVDILKKKGLRREKGCDAMR